MDIERNSRELELCQYDKKTPFNIIHPRTKSIFEVQAKIPYKWRSHLHL